MGEKAEDAEVPSFEFEAVSVETQTPKQPEEKDKQKTEPKTDAAADPTQQKSGKGKERQVCLHTPRSHKTDASHISQCA